MVAGGGRGATDAGGRGQTWADAARGAGRLESVAPADERRRREERAGRGPASPILATGSTPHRPPRPAHCCHSCTMHVPTRSLNPFRVLATHRNFRIFWVGQTLSLIGTWMQSMAQGWLALE